MRRFFRKISGSLLNRASVPGFIRATPCRTQLKDVAVEVRVDPLFTVVAVQNTRLFFHRLTGRFDGIVVEAHDCMEQLDIEHS